MHEPVFADQILFSERHAECIDLHPTNAEQGDLCTSCATKEQRVIVDKLQSRENAPQDHLNRE